MVYSYPTQWHSANSRLLNSTRWQFDDVQDRPHSQALLSLCYYRLHATIRYQAYWRCLNDYDQVRFMPSHHSTQINLTSAANWKGNIHTITSQPNFLSSTSIHIIQDLHYYSTMPTLLSNHQPTMLLCLQASMLN